MCFNTFYPITNNSSGSNSPLSFVWEFGTGITTPEINPSIYVDEFFEESSFINYLSITDNNGCTVVDSFLVQMSAPSLNYYYNIDEGFCPPIYCDFQMTSPDSISFFEIDYGDGEMNTVNSASEALNISHVYDTPGYYDVVFSVTDTNGCPATALVDSMIFIPGPWATFTFSPNSGCPPLEVTFDILEQSDVDRYLWVFGDGYTSDLQNPTHIYNLAGTYTPILIVEDTINLVNGDTLPCITSHYNDDIVIEGPIVDFFILEDTLCFGSTNNLQIENITIDLEGYEIESYEWDYGDGTTATGEFPGIHYYDEPGTYSISLTATTTNGCVYTMIKDNGVFVMAPPPIQPYVEYTLTCPPMLVNFYADSVPSSNDDITYYWDFGDGQSATDFNTSHMYTSDANFTAYLTTRIDSCEFIHSLSDQIASFPVPDAAFISTPIFGNNTIEEIQFENTSTGEDYIEWYLSNSYFSNENTINVAAQTDDLIMFLVAYNGFDCSDTAWFSLHDYSWDIPNVITPNGDGNNDFFVLNYEGFGPCIELSIYNRWGTLIYQNANYKDDWYGKNQSGQKVSDGTYFYIINVCNKASITGYITVIH
jgi:gliding motility-associated-like protein